MVTVRGSCAACHACEERIRELLQEMRRGKTKAQAKKKLQCHSAWPSACALCDCRIDSLKSAFDHVGSARHFACVEGRVSTALPAGQPAGPGNILGVVAFLENVRVGELHVELGFDVEALLKAAPALEDQRLAANALRHDISRQPACFEWLRVEQRWRTAWDESPRNSGESSGILEAPSFEEMCMRCLLDESPPLIREVGLPVFLPKAPHKSRKERVLKGKHRFPFEPSSRLGVVVLLQRCLAPEEFDVICGTSLIKALSGDSSRCADKYFLQKFGGALCCLHVTTAFHDQDDAGHAVETLLCGSDCKKPRSFFCSSQVRIGNHRVLITSEVDARDSKNILVEIKSSGSKRGAAIVNPSTALQVACNGSGHVLCCGLDVQKTQLLDVQTVPAADTWGHHRSAFTSNGQRVAFLLERLCNDPLFNASLCTSSELAPVVQLTFNEIKAPILEPAPDHIRVLPLGLPRI